MSGNVDVVYLLFLLVHHIFWLADATLFSDMRVLSLTFLNLLGNSKCFRLTAMIVRMGLVDACSVDVLVVITSQAKALFVSLELVPRTPFPLERNVRLGIGCGLPTL